MNRDSKFYVVFFLILGFSFVGLTADQVSNFYENNVATNVCEGDSNIIKAGCSVAVGQVVRVTPGILTGVTVDKMKDCYDRYAPGRGGSASGVIDLNDPCNQIALFNPQMKKENYAYVPINDEDQIRQSRSGFASAITQMEAINRQVTTGKLLFNNNYYAAQTFKNIPFLEKSFAATSASQGANKITEFVFKVWTLSRNIAYLILLLASLGVGILIMIGSTDKDNKTKVSLELAIPRVVIAVILISSSYWVGELVLSMILGSGIIQGFAAFFAQALAPTSASPGAQDIANVLGMAGATVIMGVIAVITTATAGAGIVVIIFALAMAVYQLFLVNILMIKNIFELLVYIIYSPIVLIGGVLPSDNNYNVFRKHGQKLVKFIAVGFLLGLINYGSKAIMIYSFLYDSGTPQGGPFDGANEVFGGVLAHALIGILGLAAYIYILYQAKNVDALADKFATKLVGIKKDKDKDKDKDKE